MTAAAHPGGAGGPPAEPSRLDLDLAALRTISRHLRLLAEDYCLVESTAAAAMHNAANWVETASECIVQRSHGQTVKREHASP